MEQLKCIVGARVSHLDDDAETTRKVSHLAQVADGQRWVDQHNYVTLSTFTDLGVSAGKTTPFERPGLQEWLQPDRLHLWQVIVFQKIDRAFRSTTDCVQFAQWCKDNRKILAFSGDGIVLDYYHPAGDSLDQMMSEFFIYVGSFFAAIELSRFKTRATDRLAHLQMTDRVSHGVAPLGFMTVPHPSGQGKKLVRDPDGYELLHTIRRKLVDEHLSLTAVVRWLNDSGYQSNRAKATGGGEWSVSTLKRILVSDRLQGYRTVAVFDGKKRVGEKQVLDSTGSTIRMADPTFTEYEWESLQAALAARSQSGRRRVVTDNPLAGVGYCGCGKALVLHRKTSSNGTVHTYVRCGGSCRGGKRLDYLQTALEMVFLSGYGDREMTKQVFIPGEDRSRELAQVEQSLERLRWESDNGLVDDEELYRSRLSALVARRNVLVSEPVVPARYEHVGVGKTYRELWGEDGADRRQLLRDSGVKLIVGFLPYGSTGATKTAGVRLDTPAGWPQPVWAEEMFRVMAEAGIAGIEIDGDQISVQRHHSDSD